jgi:hypothetical protein
MCVRNLGRLERKEQTKRTGNHGAPLGLSSPLDKKKASFNSHSRMGVVWSGRCLLSDSFKRTLHTQPWTTSGGGRSRGGGMKLC